MRSSGIPLSSLNAKMQDQVMRQLHPRTSNVPPTARPYPLTLWLDYKVPSWNRMVSQHWSKLHHEKAKAKKALDSALDLVGWPTMAPTVKMHVILTMYRCRPIDIDNCACKPLVDQIRYAKLLADDNPDAMALTLQQIKVKTRAEEGTRVVLTEALL